MTGSGITKELIRMGPRNCPVCGEPCANKLQSDGDIFDIVENYCAKCNGELTPEGLLCRRIPESTKVQLLGKGGDVVWEYDTAQVNVAHLVEKILELESQCREVAGTTPTPISLGAARWNLNSLMRRLRRWVIVSDAPLIIADRNLRECANRVLRKQWEEAEIDEGQWDTKWIVDEFSSGKNGHLDNVINYERTKLLEPPIVLGHLPHTASKALSEAREAFRWGLPLATVALCRLVLEEAVHVAWEAYCQVRGVTPIPRKKRRLRSRPKQGPPAENVLDGLPEEILTPKEKTKVHQLLDDGNNAVHYAHVQNAGEVLFDTVDLLTTLMNRLPGK
jgi:hypothetical protein